MNVGTENRVDSTRDRERTNVQSTSDFQRAFGEELGLGDADGETSADGDLGFDAQRLFDRIDTNDDDVVDRDELTTFLTDLIPGLQGVLDPEELSAEEEAAAEEAAPAPAPAAAPAAGPAPAPAGESAEAGGLDKLIEALDLNGNGKLDPEELMMLIALLVKLGPEGLEALQGIEGIEDLQGLLGEDGLGTLGEGTGIDLSSMLGMTPGTSTPTGTML
ncbi:hypothetical protein GCM10011322_09660 [Salinarimonas ramus]|uniref:EF-hand domain-containing protein n=2 Tax=Salinarimonas ramus TaxID=690164 RepID=A0A917Q707_9HYPH|nr:hypothetical protein GCM10011322_09660 [Salinarimonas ramus]